MTRFLLDTNHASAIWRNDSRMGIRLSSELDPELGLCSPSIGELWFMVFKSARAESNRIKMEVFIQRFAFWEFDYPSTIEFGRIRTELHRKGRPIPSIDIQIAAIARTNDLVLLTSDKHFIEIEQLKTQNWLSS